MRVVASAIRFRWQGPANWNSLYGVLGVSSAARASARVGESEHAVEALRRSNAALTAGSAALASSVLSRRSVGAMMPVSTGAAIGRLSRDRWPRTGWVDRSISGLLPLLPSLPALDTVANRSVSQCGNLAEPEARPAVARPSNLYLLGNHAARPARGFLIAGTRHRRRSIGFRHAPLAACPRIAPDQSFTANGGLDLRLDSIRAANPVGKSLKSVGFSTSYRWLSRCRSDARAAFRWDLLGSIGLFQHFGIARGYEIRDTPVGSTGQRMPPPLAFLPGYFR